MSGSAVVVEVLAVVVVEVLAEFETDAGVLMVATVVYGLDDAAGVEHEVPTVRYCSVDTDAVVDAAAAAVEADDDGCWCATLANACR